MNLRWNKKSKYRFLRNIPVSWIHQSLSGYDRTEFLFRIFIQLVCFILVFSINTIFILQLRYNLIFSFIITHTLFWIFNGPFMAVMVVSFSKLKNGGIVKVLKIIKYIKADYEASDCAEAVLIYGSFCRKLLHDRSDLDIRVIRKKSLKNSLKCMCIAAKFRFIATFIGMPLDLLVVDSMDFLNSTMRDDEHPVIINRDTNFDHERLNKSIKIDDVFVNPKSVLKNY